MSMKASRILPVLIVIVFASMVLATSMDVAVKRIGAGEAIVEKTRIRVVSVEDDSRIVGRWRQLVGVYVTLIVDTDGNYNVVLKVESGSNSRTVSRTVYLNANTETTIYFDISPPLRDFNGFKHSLEVSKL